MAFNTSFLHSLQNSVKATLKPGALVVGCALWAAQIPLGTVQAAQAALSSPAEVSASIPTQKTKNFPTSTALEEQMAQALAQLGPAMGFMVVSMLEMAGAEVLLPLSICPETVQLHNLVSQELQDGLNKVELELSKLPSSQGAAQGATPSLAAMQGELTQFRLKVREQAAQRRARAVEQLGPRLAQVCRAASKESAPQAQFLTKHTDEILAYAKTSDWTKPPVDADLPAVLQGGDKSPFAVALKRYLEVYSRQLGL